MSSTKIIFIFFLLTYYTTSAYKQELILIDTNEGKVSTFYEPIVDTSHLNLKSVNRICVKGIWSFFAGFNHTLGHYLTGSSGPASLCENKKVAFKSFRFGGALETTSDALSLYTGQYPFTGPEIFIDTSPVASIHVPIKSFVSTGPSKWTLFEGPNFDGKSICWKGSLSPMALYNFQTRLTALSTIGSVVKGCPQFVDEILREDLRQMWNRIQNLAI